MSPPKLNVKLSDDLVRQIKAYIWEGATQEQVAKHFALSQTHISRIVRGLAWFSVPWPDGDIGRFSEKRVLELRTGSQIASPELRAPTTEIRPSREAVLTQALEQSAADTIPNSNPPAISIEEAARRAEETAQARVEQRSEIAALGEAAEQGMQATLEQSIQPTDSSPRTARADVEDDTLENFLSWDYITEKMPGIPAVELGLNRPEFRPAICQALTALSEADWNTPRALVMVRAVARVQNLEEKIHDEETKPETEEP